MTVSRRVPVSLAGVLISATVDCADAIATVDAYLSTWQDGSWDRNEKVACHKGQLGIKVPHTTPGAPA